MWTYNLSFSRRIRKSISTILNSQIFDLQADEPGVLVIQIVFSIVWQLLDASLDDEGLLQLTPETKSGWPTKSQDMEIDGYGNSDVTRLEHKERLKNTNTVMAIELIGQFLQNKVTSRILYLARQNMSELHSLQIFFLNSLCNYLVQVFKSYGFTRI